MNKIFSLPKKVKNQKGFSLIEVVVTTAAVSVFAGTSLPQLSSYAVPAQDTDAKTFIQYADNSEKHKSEKDKKSEKSRKSEKDKKSEKSKKSEKDKKSEKSKKSEKHKSEKH